MVQTCVIYVPFLVMKDMKNHGQLCQAAPFFILKAPFFYIESKCSGLPPHIYYTLVAGTATCTRSTLGEASRKPRS